jgi:hypothetical protein
VLALVEAVEPLGAAMEGVEMGMLDMISLSTMNRPFPCAQQDKFR